MEKEVPGKMTVQEAGHLGERRAVRGAVSIDNYHQLIKRRLRDGRKTGRVLGEEDKREGRHR